MLRATISSLLAHKLRLALTTLAIVLGVAFVSGTLIYTDTVRSSFDSVLGQIAGSVDLSVRGISQLEDARGGNQFAAERPAVPPEIADQVAAVEGVAAVERNVEGFAQLLDRDGQPIGAGQGPPTLGFNAPVVSELAPSELRRGRYPIAADEVALDAATAAAHDFAVGDTVRIAANGPVAAYEVVGVFGFSGGVDNLAGASVTLFAPDRAFELFNRDGGYAGVDVLAADDARLGDLRDRITGAAGADYEVITSDQLAAESQQAADTILGFLNTGLLVFAGVSLLVGAFLINNTFAIIVAQRARELALLRAVGATRRQVRSIVRWESVMIAVLGAVFGIAVGTLFGWMTVRALADQGFSTFAFPTGQVSIAVVAAALAGTVAAVLPARRAARVDVLRAIATT